MIKSTVTRLVALSSLVVTTASKHLQQQQQY